MLWTAPPPARECHECGAGFYIEFVQCMSLFLALFGHGVMSELSPLCAQKRPLNTQPNPPRLA
jgi:hypothetical protein